MRLGNKAWNESWGLDLGIRLGMRLGNEAWENELQSVKVHSHHTVTEIGKLL